MAHVGISDLIIGAEVSCAFPKSPLTPRAGKLAQGTPSA